MIATLGLRTVLALTALVMACEHAAPPPEAPPTPLDLTELPVVYGADGAQFDSRFIAPTRRAIRAGLLFAPDWYGVYDYPISEARRLAKLGFAVLVVDVYGAGIRPKNDAEAARLFGSLHADRRSLRARISAAHRELSKRLPLGSKISAFGFSMGGMTVLELARSGADLSGVVVLSGILDHPGASDASAIRAPVLLLHGTQDALAPLEQLLALTRELDAAGRHYRAELYGGAAHAFTNQKFQGVTEGPLRYSSTHAPEANAEVISYLSALHPEAPVPAPPG